jgi:DNA-binding NarL/FixJ family response regulator
MALWAEGLNPDYAKDVAADTKKQADAGIQVIAFSGDTAKQYLAKAYEAGWKGVIDKSPVHGAKLRELLSK